MTSQIERWLQAQPDHGITWDEFTAREAGEDRAGMKPSRKRAEAKGALLSGLLLEAIHAASTRRGRISRAERIREQTLLEVLAAAMRVR